MLVQQPSDAGRMVVRCCANDGSMLYNFRSRLLHTCASAASEVCPLSRGYATPNPSTAQPFYHFQKSKKRSFIFLFFFFFIFLSFTFSLSRKGGLGGKPPFFSFSFFKPCQKRCLKNPSSGTILCQNYPHFWHIFEPLQS